jgi:hypothetical protein
MNASPKTARWLVFALLGFVCATSSKGEAGMTGDLSRIDHVILGVNDLERGIEELERLTGVRAVFGGAHPGRGTHNALISLGGSQYLEILAPNPKDESPAWIGELKSLASLTPVGWAAKGEDLPALQQSLRSQSVPTGEVRPGERKKPDGTRLAWKTLELASPSSDLLPFFIEWDAGSAHPSATSPAGCKLTGFILEDPAPDTLRKTLQAAGLAVEVRQAQESGLRISLACPKGNVELARGLRREP